MTSGSHTAIGYFAHGAPDCLISLHRHGRVWRAVVIRRSNGSSAIAGGNGAAAAAGANNGANGGSGGGGGGASAAGLQIASVHDLPADASFSERLHGLISTNNAEQVIRVLPGGTVILRTLNMPPLEEGDLETALELQAEAILPASLPPHRRAAAVLPFTAAPGEHAAVAVGWPERSSTATAMAQAAAARRTAADAAATAEAGGGDAPPSGVATTGVAGSVPAGAGVATRDADRLPELPDEVITSYTGESIALVELFARVPGAEGVAGVIDPANRSAEIVISRGGSVNVRTTRLRGARITRAALDDLIVETAIALNVEDPQLEADLGRLRDAMLEGADASAGEGPVFAAPVEVLNALRDRVAGIPRSNDAASDLSWWRRYGVAALAGIGVFGPRAAVFDLQAEAPKPPTSPILRFAYWISSPRRAAAVLVAALLFAIGAPWFSAYARHQIVESRFGHISTDGAGAAEGLTATDLAYYAALEKQRWPVLKILSDITNGSDQHLMFETITIRQGEEIKITGAVPEAQQGEVYELAANLDVTGAYSVLIPSMRPNAAGQNEFEISIRVNDAYIDVPPRHDWYGESLSTVLYGEDGTADPVDFPTGLAFDQFDQGGDGAGGAGGGETLLAERGGDRTASRRGGDGTSGGSGTADSGSGSPGTSASSSGGRTSAWDVGNLRGEVSDDDIPAELSDADIAEMSADEVQEALKIRSLLKFRQSIDKGVRDRLNDEWRRLNTQRKKLAEQAANSGASEDG